MVFSRLMVLNIWLACFYLFAVWFRPSDPALKCWSSTQGINAKLCKNTEKGRFDQHLECAAPEHLSKFTTIQKLINYILGEHVTYAQEILKSPEKWLRTTALLLQLLRNSCRLALSCYYCTMLDWYNVARSLYRCMEREREREIRTE